MLLKREGHRITCNAEGGKKKRPHSPPAPRPVMGEVDPPGGRDLEIHNAMSDRLGEEWGESFQRKRSLYVSRAPKRERRGGGNRIETE